MAGMFASLFLFALAINASAFFINGYLEDIGETGILQPTEEQPKIFNQSQPENETYLVGNLTTPKNETDDEPFDLFLEDAFVNIQFLWTIFQFFSLGFVIDVFSNMFTAMGVTVPEDLVFGLNAVFGITFAAFLYKMITGRTIPPFE